MPVTCYAPNYDHTHSNVEETIKKRLDIYYEQTQPILNFFKQEGIKIIDINGIGSIESIQENILDKLKE